MSLHIFIWCGSFPLSFCLLVLEWLIVPKNCRYRKFFGRGYDCTKEYQVQYIRTQGWHILYCSWWCFNGLRESPRAHSLLLVGFVAYLRAWNGQTGCPVSRACGSALRSCEGIVYFPLNMSERNWRKEQQSGLSLWKFPFHLCPEERYKLYQRIVSIVKPLVDGVVVLKNIRYNYMP